MSSLDVGYKGFRMRVVRDFLDLIEVFSEGEDGI